MKKVGPITLAIFRNLFAALCEEMGVVLARSAFSTNIKERKDFSCALFDSKGRLVAQAAHIPVHLGSMPLSVAAAVHSFQLDAGDTILLNDPYRGGTHLPDMTMVAPVFVSGRKGVAYFVANRAHHADVGGASPGSMPLTSHVSQEGIVIPPTRFFRKGRVNKRFLNSFLKRVHHPRERLADLHAQQASIAIGVQRLIDLTDRYGLRTIDRIMRAYREYEREITLAAIRKMPEGSYSFHDFLDEDGFGNRDIRICATVAIRREGVLVDFSESSPQVEGPVNAPYAVTLSATAYVFRSLVLALTGEDLLSLDPIRIKTRPGSVVHATYPAPVAGGNVETSQRIVDVLLGALSRALPHRIPAASQGTMNNLACGNEGFSYYETIAGGMGGRPDRPGIDAVHTHMTNSQNTPIEALEQSFPIRITQYRIRKGSGGRGRHRGGDGLIREYEFLEKTHVSLLTERRRYAPYGLHGGGPGKRGVNWLIGRGKKRLPGKVELDLKKGERIRIETPGGGGFSSSYL